MSEIHQFPRAFEQFLRCPRCHSTLKRVADTFRCAAAECGVEFPIVDDVPILIDEARSIFSIQDFVAKRRTTLHLDRQSWRQKLAAALPELAVNVHAERNYRVFADKLFEVASAPRVLVVGGGILGHGMRNLVNERRIELVETDVALGPRTALVCDAHDLPFADACFDGAVAQAVLEHVVDPYRCVEEIRRVLRPGGVVYAETPFMQQVHLGRFDFTRFTDLGHRRLFRGFNEIRSGAACGPGSALAWAYQYFMLSFARTRATRSFLLVWARLTGFFWKYFDHWLIDRPAALDAASALYFIGTRSESVLTDRELVRRYRGAQ